jgi:hypothetical protein
MYGIPSALTYDVAVATQKDYLNRADHAHLMREAASSRHGQVFILGSIRRAIGNALIAAGRSVGGDRVEPIDLSEVPSVGAVGLAR